MDLVHRNFGIKNTCSEKDGWYPDGLIAKLRAIMKPKWFELFKTLDLASLAPHKLEEILEAITPGSNSLHISGLTSTSWAEKIADTIKDAEADAEDDGEVLEDSDTGSDYEIYD